MRWRVFTAQASAAPCADAFRAHEPFAGMQATHATDVTVYSCTQKPGGRCQFVRASGLAAVVSSGSWTGTCACTETSACVPHRCSARCARCDMYCARAGRYAVALTAHARSDIASAHVVRHAAQQCSHLRTGPHWTRHCSTMRRSHRTARGQAVGSHARGRARGRHSDSRGAQQQRGLYFARRGC